MAERLWKKIKECSRRNVAVRIIALFFVVPYIVVRDIVRWGKSVCSETSLSRRMAAAFAVCLAITTAFSGHAFIVMAEEGAIVVEDPASDAAGQGDAGAGDTEQSGAGDAGTVDPAETDAGEAGTGGPVKTDEVDPDMQVPTDDPANTDASGEEQNPAAEDGSEVTETTPDPESETEAVSLVTDIVSPIGTQYEKVAVVDVVEGEDGAEAGVTDTEQDFLYVLSITNQSDKDVSGITVSSDAFDFIYKRPEEQEDGSLVLSSFGKSKKGAPRKCTVSDVLPAGEKAYIAMLAVAGDDIFIDDEGHEVYDFDIAVSVAGKKVVSHGVTADIVHEMQDFRAEREAAGVDFSAVGDPDQSVEAVTGPATEVEEVVAPEDTADEDDTADEITEVAATPEPVVDQSGDDATETEVADVEEAATGAAAEPEEALEEQKDEDDDGIISVTLPTSFDIPMVNVDNSLEVLSDDINIRNRSEFPIDVRISSVNVSIKQSIDNKIYSTTLCTNSEYVYDLDEIAEHSDIDLHLLTNTRGEEIYRLSEGENTNVARFKLDEGRENSDKAGSVEGYGSTSGITGRDEASVNLRGKIMKGIFLPGMRCDLRVQVVFDFNKAKDLP